MNREENREEKIKNHIKETEFIPEGAREIALLNRGVDCIDIANYEIKNGDIYE